MTDEAVVEFNQLTTADLVLERIYRGGTARHVGDDPLGRLLPGIGNQGGFRPPGPLKPSVKLVVLYTSGGKPNWPDALDPHTGTFTYFGDNRSPGRDLHDTPRRGNQLLRDAFERAAAGPSGRAQVPPFFLFDKPGTGRDVRFRGLLAPGAGLLGSGEDLVAIWRTTHGLRFQNYRARFSVLDVHTVPRAWISQLRADQPLGEYCPAAWRTWVETGTYKSLQAPATVITRSRDEQQPLKEDRPLLRRVYEHFKDRPHDFEYFAADLWRMTEPKVDKIDVTRPWRDGGRDAIGEYLLGPASDPVAVEFALEAKCYASGTGVGVRETSRLISRLRHRQFGVLVTTSHLDGQAYKEIREDGHPIVILAAIDIVTILKSNGFTTTKAVSELLRAKYAPQ